MYIKNSYFIIYSMQLEMFGWFELLNNGNFQKIYIKTFFPFKFFIYLYIYRGYKYSTNDGRI